MTNDEAIRVVDEQRHVTPNDPLVIDEPKVTFYDVVIEGGEIIAQVETQTTFGKLTKSSGEDRR